MTPERKIEDKAEEFFGIDPTGKSPEQVEREWFENYYHGEIPQLTVRAVIIGVILGGVMSLSNLYVGLKTGWGLGVAFVIPFWNTLSMFVGDLIAWILSKSTRSFAESYTIPVASGLIAGESLMGVIIALLAASGVMR
jgi:uncharacterized oligopeptide transporter (OPT) family protein